VAYREHPAKVVRLDAEGQLTGYPPAEAQDRTVWFSIDDTADWEGLLGQTVGPDRVAIVGIPIFVYNVNLGDEVAVTRTPESAAVATVVVRDAGNYTFRVWFEREPPRPGEHWLALMHDLASCECWFDTWSEKLVAISASAAYAQEVADYLSKHERNNDLRYETGRIKGRS
jgi:hypothetical protein